MSAECHGLTTVSFGDIVSEAVKNFLPFPVPLEHLLGTDFIEKKGVIFQKTNGGVWLGESKFEFSRMYLNDLESNRISDN